MSLRTTGRDPKGTKILHVEDNPENRLLIRTLLEAEGYTVVEAEDGLAGIEAALREPPALILLDINLPGVDGYAVASILKSFPALAGTPLIAITAYGMEGDRQRTLVAGCDGYLNKPIDVDSFPHQVADFLRGKRERVEEAEESPYLRELNQRLVYRLVNQVEELKGLNEHFIRRATQLEQLHVAVQDITSELGVQALLERFLPALAQALGATSLTVTLTDPTGLRVVAEGAGGARPRGVLQGTGAEGGGAVQWEDVELTLPLSVHERALGTLTARLVLPPGAKSDEEQLFKIVANQVSIAVENAWLYQDAQQRLRQTATLLEVSHAIGSTLELSEVARRTTREIVRLLGADIGAAWLVAGGPDRLVPLAGYHVPKDIMDGLAESVPGDRLVEEVKQLRGPLYASDTANDPRFTHPFLARLPHKSVLILPMYVKDEPIGGFSIVWTHTAHAFTDEEIRLVEGIARQAAVAIENSRLYENLKHQMEELRRTQAQLIQSAKLAAIGELTANVAHEINNPLTSVLGFASYLTEQMAAGQPMWEELDLIRSEAQRARDIVRDLLDFSRPRDFMPEPADLNQVVQQTLRMVQRQGALDHIEVREQYADSMPTIEVDVPRLKQVFLNIINNALHAMGESGVLTVRTALTNGGVRVDFTDTGSGISPEHRDRIFDPFFTTKPEVTGTGLGLSVSLGLVRHHGGTIEVESELGNGSTFTIKLPSRRGLGPAAEPS